MGWAEALPAAIGRTWEYSVLTLQVIWRVLTGEASIHNLSGPITSPTLPARRQASVLSTFSSSWHREHQLGVLNLLPIPVLDGGHLLYFAIEAVKGVRCPRRPCLHGQKIGLMLLLGLMTVAFYVDILRLLGWRDTRLAAYFGSANTL